MASVCISECVDNVCIIPASRPTSYMNLQRCNPAAEEENNSADQRERRRPRPREAEGISRRQMYLRSYTFSREDAVDASKSTAQSCLGKLRRPPKIRRRSRCFAVVRAVAKQASSGGELVSMFRRWLCCVAPLDTRGRKHWG